MSQWDNPYNYNLVLGAFNEYGSLNSPFEGNLAHAILFTAALSDAEILEMASGKLNTVMANREWHQLPFGEIRDHQGAYSPSGANSPAESSDGPPVFGAL